MPKQFLTSKQAQANTEYLFLALLILLLILPVIYFGLQSSYENYRLLQTDNILNNMGNAADNMNTLGTGNKKTILIEVPQGVTGAVVKGNVLSIKSDTREGTIPLTKSTKTKLVGSFSVEQGRHSIPIAVIGSNLVRIGEGLALFTMQPTCLGITELPATITLTGDGITTETALLKNGEPYGGTVNYINPTTLTFTAGVETFSPIEGIPYSIKLQDTTTTSSALLFYVHPLISQCGTTNELLVAHLTEKTTHTFIEDIVTQVEKDDGYYQQLPTNELIHLTFTNNLKKNDFLEITYQCSEDSILTLLEEGTSTLVGTVSCKKNTWEMKRLYISIPVTQNNVWDLTSSVDVDIDYISAFTV